MIENIIFENFNSIDFLAFNRFVYIHRLKKTSKKEKIDEQKRNLKIKKKKKKKKK